MVNPSLFKISMDYTYASSTPYHFIGITVKGSELHLKSANLFFDAYFTYPRIGLKINKGIGDYYYIYLPSLWKYDGNVHAEYDDQGSLKLYVNVIGY